MNGFAVLARQLRSAYPDAPTSDTRMEPASPVGFRPTGSIEQEALPGGLRRPMVAGAVIIAVLVVGLLLWSAMFSIAGAVNASGVVRVENNSKVVKSREGGVIRQILVREGQSVRHDQVLIRLDPVQAKAGVDISQSDYDSALANAARFQAEATDKPVISFPPELLQRQDDLAIATLLASQRGLFQSNMILYSSQAAVLRGQVSQLDTQIQGLRAQMKALDTQSGLINDELSGVRELSNLGYAPKSRLLALQRSAAEIAGQRGSLLSEIGRAAQGIGNIRLQIAQLEDKRQTDAADGLRMAQEKITAAAPKLRANSESLEQTIVRAPVDGHVFNLTQFTEGGVAQPGETLLQVVPTGTPLIITARVRPTDIASVRVGLPVRLTLTAYNPRTTPQVDGRVSLVAADATVDEATHESFYAVQIKVDPAALAKAGPDVHLSPGMPAGVSIVTGTRTVMDYLLGPMLDSMRSAMRER